MSAAIRWSGVTKRYGGTAVVDDVSVAIERGSFVALVGTSGSGKSTLLKMANRLIEPDAGTIEVDGHATGDRPAPLLRRRIGYVFQNVGLFPHMNVAENIAIGARIAGAPSLDVAALLALVDLPVEIGVRFPAALSGGQRQRVGVARALATEPAIVLLDEPFGALDPVTRDALGTAYRALHDRLGLTTIMVTHDMAEALLLADRVLAMKAGRIVADATPHALLSDAAGPDAATLVAVPRAQAARLAELAARG